MSGNTYKATYWHQGEIQESIIENETMLMIWATVAKKKEELFAFSLNTIEILHKGVFMPLYADRAFCPNRDDSIPAIDRCRACAHLFGAAMACGDVSQDMEDRILGKIFDSGISKQLGIQEPIMDHPTHVNYPANVLVMPTGDTGTPIEHTTGGGARIIDFRCNV
jgi:hypothetical protein